MGYLIIIGVAALITVILGIVANTVKNSPDPSEQRFGKGLRVGALIGFILIFLIVTPLRMFHSVKAGHVGVVYQFGNIVDQRNPGLKTIWPWQTIQGANVQIQRVSFDQLDSFSSETQDVFIKATINYQVSPKDIQNLYRTVGPDYFDKLVPNRVNQFFKDETVKYTAVEIAPNRDQIRADVLRRLKTELAPYSIQIDDLLIDNISFSQEFTKAIEDKQIATQEAQAAKNRVKQAQYQAEQIIKTAQGQAEANRLQRQTLTPLLIQQRMIDKLNPNVQVILLPSNSNLLLPSSAIGK